MMNEDHGSFEKAARSRPPGLAREVLDLLRQNKKWWLLPIIVALVIVGAIIAIAVVFPGAAPFIYPLF